MDQRFLASSAWLFIPLPYADACMRIYINIYECRCTFLLYIISVLVTEVFFHRIVDAVFSMNVFDKFEIDPFPFSRGASSTSTLRKFD